MQDPDSHIGTDTWPHTRVDNQLSTTRKKSGNQEKEVRMASLNHYTVKMELFFSCKDYIPVSAFGAWKD